IELLKKIKKETTRTFEYQDYPFDLLVEKLELDRDLSQSPIFNVMLAFDNTDAGSTELSIPGLKAERYVHQDDFNMSKFDLTLFIDRNGDEMTVQLEYNSDLFEKDTARNMAVNFINLAEAALIKPGTALSKLQYIAPAEYERVVREFNETGVPFPPTTIRKLVEQQVEKTPGKIAVVHNEETVTYEDLNKKANRLAHYLREEYKIKPGEVVGVFMD
ncbi:MAG: AMP-binding protein, partial [bacterium]|nr:AMP-binding protein [bacterium]